MLWSCGGCLCTDDTVGRAVELISTTCWRASGVLPGLCCYCRPTDRPYRAASAVAEARQHCYHAEAGQGVLQDASKAREACHVASGASPVSGFALSCVWPSGQRPGHCRVAHVTDAQSDTPSETVPHAASLEPALAAAGMALRSRPRGRHLGAGPDRCVPPKNPLLGVPWS